jgi:hypothetical protein
MRVRFPAVAMAGFLLWAGPLFAHHSQAMFDDQKTVTQKGVISKFAWVNPHVWIFVDVKNGQGETQTWGLEANAASTMSRLGWTRTQFKAGDPVTFTVWPRRDGKSEGLLSKITGPDGKELSLPRNPPNKPR